MGNETPEVGTSTKVNMAFASDGSDGNMELTTVGMGTPKIERVQEPRGEDWYQIIIKHDNHDIRISDGDTEDSLVDFAHWILEELEE